MAGTKALGYKLIVLTVIVVSSVLWTGRRHRAVSRYGLRTGMEYPLNDTKTRFIHKERFIQDLVMKTAPGDRTRQTHGPACDRTVQLQYIDSLPPASLPSSVFLLETSGRGTLSPRQGCTLESSALRSGLAAVVVLAARQLDLRENVTCQLYMAGLGLTFYTVDMENLAKDTPLEDFIRHGGVRSSLVPAIHLSDVLRLLLLYKFGGFYHDLDYVVLGDLSTYRHSVLEEKGKFHGELKVTNSVLAFPAKHRFLHTALSMIQNQYHGNCWDCLGPALLTSILKTEYNTSLLAGIPPDGYVQVIPRERMVPVHGDVIRSVYWPSLPTPLQHWTNLFANSSAVHFFSSGTNKLAVPREPQYSAYALLAEHYCPTSYRGTPKF